MSRYRTQTLDEFALTSPRRVAHTMVVDTKRRQCLACPDPDRHWARPWEEFNQPIQPRSPNRNVPAPHRRVGVRRVASRMERHCIPCQRGGVLAEKLRQGRPDHRGRGFGRKRTRLRGHEARLRPKQGPRITPLVREDSDRRQGDSRNRCPPVSGRFSDKQQPVLPWITARKKQGEILGRNRPVVRIPEARWRFGGLDGLDERLNAQIVIHAQHGPPHAR